MIGALAGDIIGSVYEFNNIKTKDFPLFSKESFYTDDSIMTIAVADWLLHGGDLVRVMQYYGSKYPFPMGGYGARFDKWLHEKNPKPYNSWGNGSAMRVSPVGWYFDSLEENNKTWRKRQLWLLIITLKESKELRLRHRLFIWQEKVNQKNISAVLSQIILAMI